MFHHFLLILGIVLGPLLLSCGGSVSSGNSTSGLTKSAVFPASLAVSSPLKGSASSGSTLMRDLGKHGIRFSRAFDADTDDIIDILNGSSTSSCSFDPSQFLTRSTNADCYGPTIKYKNHPDDTSGSTLEQELPSGDLGIWQETDSSTSEACSAAQLNARMDGVSAQMNAGLEAAASMTCLVHNTSSLSMPSNSTTDLTTDMSSTLGTSSLSFNTATITHSDSNGQDEYTYNLIFTYSDGTNSYDINVELYHIPGCQDYAYEGRLKYTINDYATGGNCPVSGSTTPVTRAGSLVYNKKSDYTMAVDGRTAQFCGHNAADPFDSNGQVNPSEKYDASSNTDGWGNDFNRFLANFNPTTLVGQYAYLWQAGHLDNYSRTFNIFLSRNTDTDILSGHAFFGFGSDISTTDGTINGFICNWAGPGGAVDTGANLTSSVTLSSTVQKQDIEESSSGGTFTSTSSNITYVPTNSCDYAGGSGGIFLYDTDNDDDLSDEDSTLAVTNDLVATTQISSEGFIIPNPPSAPSATTCTSERLFTVTGEYHDGEYWDAVLRFDNAESIDSDNDGAATPDGTVPVKSDPVGSGITDSSGYQLNFVHTAYVWNDEIYLGSLFTNKNNTAGDGSGGSLMNNTSYEIGSVGVLQNASTIDGSQTLDRHLFDSTNADGTTATTTEIHQPHGIWIDESRDILYIANSFSGKILVFDNASSVDGNTAPDRVIEHTKLGAPIHVFADEDNDRLFIASVNADTSSSSPSLRYSSAGGHAEPGTPGECDPHSKPAVVVYNNASTTDGNIEPDVRILGDDTRLCGGNNQTTHNVWYDSNSNMIFASHHTKEFLMYDASQIDLAPSTATDYNLAPTRLIEIHEQTNDSDQYYWSIYGFHYLASKDRLYVASGYSSGGTSSGTSVPDSGTPPNEIKVYDGISMSHFNGQMTPTRVIQWSNGSTYYSPQGTFVVEY